MATLNLVSDPGVSLGSNVDAAPDAVPNGFGRFLKDVILDQPGIVRQRGPINGLNLGASPDFPSLPSNARIIGMTSLADPNGTDSFRLLLLVADKNTFAVKAYIYGRTGTPVTPAFHARSFFELQEPLDVSGKLHGDPFGYFDDRRTALQNFGALLATITVTGLTVLSSDSDPFFQASMALDGGNLIGIGMNYGADSNKAAHRAMLHWRGAAKAAYSTGQATYTAGSPVVVGTGTTWVGNVEPGMFLQNSTNDTTYGVVKTVTDNTHITLEQNVLRASGGPVNYSFVSFRRPFSQGFSFNVSAGAITTSTASTTVNGGGTKFVDQGVANGDWVFRASDYTFIGTVNTVQSNTQLTLTGNALIALASEGYLISRATAWTAGSEPVFSTYFNGMQLVANADNNRGGLNERSRIFVTDAKNLEAIDVTKTGSFYDLPSTKPHTDIRGLFSTEAAALAFLAEATYGIFGNSPSTLVPRVILDDGLLSPMSIQPWRGGAVWVGSRGVYYFDGASVHNLLDNRAATSHANAISGLDYSRYRVWSMMQNGHYIAFLQKINTGVYTHFQGRQSSTDSGGLTTDPDNIIYCINMNTGALVFWSNVTVRGFASPPGKLVNTREAYFVVESSQTGGPIICSASSLFREAGTTGFVQDAFITNPATADFAPHFFVEGGMHSYGDPERLKRVQMILNQYSLYGVPQFNLNGTVTSPTKLGIDIVTDMGEDTKAISPRAATTTNVAAPIKWTNKRARFGKKATVVGVRFYTMADGQPSAARLGPWSLGFKPMRVGRV